MQHSQIVIDKIIWFAETLTINLKINIQNFTALPILDSL